MKINELNSAQIQKLYQQQQEKNIEGKKIVNKDDEINISEKAREIKKIEAVLRKKSEIRENKVKIIREALANGRYRIEARKVAEKILSDLDQE